MKSVEFLFSNSYAMIMGISIVGCILYITKDYLRKHPKIKNQREGMKKIFSERAEELKTTHHYH